jgi:two-component system nitrogen regulation sensor histidine kinase GlnL
LFPGQPDLIDKIRCTADTGASFRDVECLGRRKSGHATFPASLTLSPFLDARGRARGVLLLVRDLSLLKELEETSRQSERMSNLGTLALGMAHEIKNPLGGIRGSAQLLGDQLSLPEYREYLDVIVNEVDRINRMVDHMLDFARPQRLALTDTNIHKILEDIVLLEKKSLTAKRGEFVQDYDPSLPPIKADADKLKQVFFNLIKNAVDASPEGKNIRLVTRVGSDYSLKTARRRGGNMAILVEIVDSGPGIPESDQNKLFTPFYTTKKKGSGLGLPISLKIVEDHGGKIRIMSDKIKGTAVQVLLPVRQDK